MKFPKPEDPVGGYVLEASEQAEDEWRYMSSGYELGSEERPCIYGGETRICDPILFYSRNSHRLCRHKPIRNTYPSTEFKGRENKGHNPALLLFPDSPWLKNCTRVRLMKLRNSSSSDVTEAEFAPTGRYTTSLRHHPVDVTESPMYFTVLCRVEDLCRCHGCVITLDEVWMLTSNSPVVLSIYRMDISRFWMETNLNYS
jgi:hypothetical protein